jgi:toxin ParE1/3/4
MNVVFLRSARDDLQDLRRYLRAKFGNETWLATFASIEDAVTLLTKFPQSGAIPPELAELGLPGFHQVIAGMNRIVYQIDDPDLIVHLIVDTRRDLKDVLARRLLKA